MEMDKGIATVAIWGGAIGLCYVLNSVHMLDGAGAGLLIFGDILLTAILWKC